MSFLKGSLVILASMFLTASSFAAGGSDGSSGPGGSSGGGTAGSAIPLQADGVVTTKQIEKIKNNCNIDFAYTQLTLAYGMDIRASMAKCAGSSAAEVETKGGFNFRAACYDPDFTYVFTIDGDTSKVGLDAIAQQRRVTGVLAQAYPPTLDKPALINIPRLTYTAGGSTNVVYDRFKNVVSSDTAATNLRLIHGEDPSVGLHLVNPSSNIDTGMVIDMRPLRDCLLKGVQSLNGTN